MSWGQRPMGADLLRLSGPWVAGVTINAGQCLLSHEPVVKDLIVKRCPEAGCTSRICGVDKAAFELNTVNHYRRCHSGPRAEPATPSRSARPTTSVDAPACADPGAPTDPTDGWTVEAPPPRAAEDSPASSPAPAPPGVYSPTAAPGGAPDPSRCHQ